MKRLLIIPAVMAVCTPALAESNVQLYGLLDIGYAVSNGGEIEGDNGNKGKFQQWGNGFSTSRWGLQGSEKINDSLSFIFQLESSIDPENGSSSGFDRYALVGLEGKLGTVTFGRQSTIFDDVMGEYSPTGDPNITSANANAMISSGQREDRYDSMAKYVSPEWGGFGFQASYIHRHETQDEADELGYVKDATKHLYSVAATYNWNDLSIGAVYESKPNSSRDVNLSWGIGATYDFGAFSLGAGYINNHYKEDGKGFYVGASVPYNAFTFSAQIAYNTDARIDNPNRLNGVEKIKPLAWELTATYDLSKRSNFYVSYGGINNDAKSFAKAERKYSFTAGLSHSF